MTNTPHVLFFKPIIDELRKKGYKVIVTARDFSNIKDLLKKKKIRAKIIGKHGGASAIGKGLAKTKRVLALIRFIKTEKPHLCLAQQSDDAISASYVCGIKSVLHLDNDRSEFQNKIMLPLATKVVCPEPLPRKTLKDQGAKDITQYDGFKEEFYLYNFKPNRSVLRELNLNSRKPIVVIRTQAGTARYVKKEKESTFFMNTVCFFIHRFLGTLKIFYGG